MSISANTLYYLLIFTAILPAILAIRLAKKQNRSKLTSGLITFVFGLSLIGGWIYLAIMNLVPPKEKTNRNQ